MSGPTVTEGQHRVDFEESLAASSSRILSSEPVSREEEASRAQGEDPVYMVDQVKGQIRAIEAKIQLAQQSRIADPRALQGLEIQRAHLVNAVLPYTEGRAREIELLKSNFPSAETTLQAEADRRDRLQAAAIKRAEELEVEEMAQRLRAQRRQTGSA